MRSIDWLFLPFKGGILVSWTPQELWQIIGFFSLWLPPFIVPFYRIYQSQFLVRKGHVEQGIELTNTTPADLPPAELPATLESVHLA